MGFLFNENDENVDDFKDEYHEQLVNFDGGDPKNDNDSDGSFWHVSINKTHQKITKPHRYVQELFMNSFQYLNNLVISELSLQTMDEFLDYEINNTEEDYRL
jgi:hypothetical protein